MIKFQHTCMLFLNLFFSGIYPNDSFVVQCPYENPDHVALHLMRCANSKQNRKCVEGEVYLLLQRYIIIRNFNDRTIAESQVQWTSIFAEF